MNKRKLQIFVSSTCEDLIDDRLAAMEAILAAGHIPTAMEQFSPGDERLRWGCRCFSESLEAHTRA